MKFSENPEGLGLPSIYTDFWDPIFRACEETGTVLNLHVGSSGTIHQPSRESPREVRVALFPVNGIETLVDWLYARIPLRFPELRIVLSEAGISWVPMAFERITKMYKQATVTGYWTDADGDPLDVARRSFYFTSIEDPAGFRLLDIIGEDHVMVEVDYPHGDSTWPTTQDLLRRDMALLDADIVAKVCHGNASALYRHSPPSADWLAGVNVRQLSTAQNATNFNG
jgi:predicted TIM-barrel fold metal-dependent hydrolase